MHCNGTNFHDTDMDTHADAQEQTYRNIEQKSDRMKEQNKKTAMSHAHTF